MTEPSTVLRLKIIAASGLSLALVSWIDFETDYEFLFFTFYFIPVSLCAWYLGRPAVLGTALLSTVAWWLMDKHGSHHYTHAEYRLWNSLTCFGCLAGVGLMVHGLRQSLDERSHANEKLTLALAELNRTTAETRSLQNQLQVICAWTKRIKVDGQWMTLEEFLTNHLHLKLTHGMSPEGIHKFVTEMNSKGGDAANTTPPAATPVPPREPV